MLLAQQRRLARADHREGGVGACDGGFARRDASERRVESQRLHVLPRLAGSVPHGVQLRERGGGDRRGGCRWSRGRSISITFSGINGGHESGQ